MRRKMMQDTIVIALGGNAIIREGEKGTIKEQYDHIKESCIYIAGLIEEGYKVIITHGNGPQIGNILIQNEAGKDLVPTIPIDVGVAETQGQLGYMIKQTLINTLREMRIDRPVVCLLSQVVVDDQDVAFQNPTKPIGPFYNEKEAEVLKNEKGYKMIEDSGRGFRRVVPSPKPTNIIEQTTIKQIVESGSIVITVGGGGIPVSEKDGIITGVEAVIDKDYASSLLASQIGAKHLVILTGVPQVAINFGKANQQFLAKLNVQEAKGYDKEGQFAPGSMGPKIGAAIDYLERGGEKVIITSMDLLKDAMEGKAGTSITK